MSSKIPAGIKAIFDKDAAGDDIPSSLRYRLRVDSGTRPDGTRRQLCSTFHTLAEAKQSLAATRVEVSAGTYTPPAKITLEDHLSKWVDGKRGLRPTTAQGYRALLRPVVRELGRKPLQRVTKADVDALVTTLQSAGGRTGGGRSARTVNLLLTVWSQAMDAAVRERLVPQNVVRLVERPAGEPVVVGQAWSAEQGIKFLEFAGRDRLAAAWRLSLCGLRRGEVLALRWSSIDWDAQTVRIDSARVLLGGRVVQQPPKTRAGLRTLPLMPEVLADLQRLRKVQAAERLRMGANYPDSDLIFVDPAGTPVRPEWYSKEFQRISRQAQLPKVRLHDARHSAATWLNQRGVRPTVAARFMGHDVAVYSRVYVHVDEADMRQAADALGAAVSGAV
jgi:integrase